MGTSAETAITAHKMRGRRDPFEIGASIRQVSRQPKRSGRRIICESRGRVVYLARAGQVPDKLARLAANLQLYIQGLCDIDSGTQSACKAVNLHSRYT